MLFLLCSNDPSDVIGGDQDEVREEAEQVPEVIEPAAAGEDPIVEKDAPAEHAE